jgi:hypothetical protein
MKKIREANTRTGESGSKKAERECNLILIALFQRRKTLEIGREKNE